MQRLKIILMIVSLSFLSINCSNNLSKARAYDLGKKLGDIHWIERTAGLEYGELCKKNYKNHSKQYARYTKEIDHISKIIFDSKDEECVKAALKGLNDSLKCIRWNDFKQDNQIRLLTQALLEHLENFIAMPATSWLSYIKYLQKHILNSMDAFTAAALSMRFTPPFMDAVIMASDPNQALTMPIKTDALNKLFKKKD